MYKVFRDTYKCKLGNYLKRNRRFYSTENEVITSADVVIVGKIFFCRKNTALNHARFS